LTYLILDFHHKVDEIYALLGNYATYSGNSLPPFQDNLSAPTSSVRYPKRRILDPWRWDCPETSVKNYHYVLHNFPEEHRYWRFTCVTTLWK